MSNNDSSLLLSNPATFPLNIEPTGVTINLARRKWRLDHRKTSP